MQKVPLESILRAINLFDIPIWGAEIARPKLFSFLMDKNNGKIHFQRKIENLNKSNCSLRASASFLKFHSSNSTILVAHFRSIGSPNNFIMKFQI